MTPREAAVAREIVRLAREELRLDAVAGAADAPLASRLDSLALLALVVAVEDRFRVALDDDVAAQARSLEELARIVAGRAAPELLPPAEPADAEAP